MENLDLILSAVAATVACGSLLINLRRRGAGRMSELSAIADASVDAAIANKHDGTALERNALEMAILNDMKDGKQDFTRAQLWGAVQAALVRRGLK